jgi:PAS domain S-box-containing protein
MCRIGQESGPHDADNADNADNEDNEEGPTAAFAALLEDSVEELYENAPCGYLSTLMDGTIAKINTTLLDWIGLEGEAVVGRMRFTDLLTVGGKLYHETHFSPLLRMQGELSGIALEIKEAGGGRIPVLVSSVVKHGGGGEPQLIRTTVFDARDRRAYEEELLRPNRRARRRRRTVPGCRTPWPCCSSRCCRTPCPRCRDWTRPPTTAPLPRTGSAATSTISSPSTPIASPSSSAMCAARAPKPPRSPH